MHPLERYLQDNNITQKALCEQIGITERQMISFRRGGEPSMETMKKINRVIPGMALEILEWYLHGK